MKYKVLFTIIVFGFLIYLPKVNAVSAGSLSFDKSTVSVNSGDTFLISVTVDAGSDEITGAQAYVTYDASFLEAQSVAAGSFFPVVSNNIASGTVSIFGLVSGTTLSKTGSGTLGTITFKALKSGSTNLTFDCQAGVTATSMISKRDDSGTNVIVCSSNGSSVVTIGGGTTNPTATPTVAAGGGGSTAAATPTTASQLPQTGYIENIMTFGGLGMGLFILGIIARIMVL